MRRLLSIGIALLLGALILGWALHFGRQTPPPPMRSTPPQPSHKAIPTTPPAHPINPSPPPAPQPAHPTEKPQALYWLRGIAVTPDHQPIQDFELKLFSHYAPSVAPEQRQVIHDAHGEFELSCQAGPFDLVATASGFMPGLLPQVIPASSQEEATPLEIILIPGGRIQGMVQNARGQPVSGALVQLAQYAHHTQVGEWPAEVKNGLPELQRAFQQAVDEEIKRMNPNPWTETGPDGHFTLTELPQGTYPLSASHPDYAPASKQVVLHPGTQLDNMTLILPDLRLGSILLTAIDGQGAPLDGVAIRAERAGASSATAPAVVTGHTNAQGTFRLKNLVAGLYLITGTLEDSHAPNASSIRSANVPIGAGQDKQVKMTFELGATIIGQVDRAGQPVAGVPIVITQEPLEASGESGAAPAESSSITARAYAMVTTDAQGHFEAQGLIPGAYQLSVMEPGHAAFPFTIHPSETRRSLAIHLATTVLFGTVRDARTTAPIANATVRPFLLESFDEAGQQVDSFYATAACHAFSNAAGAYRCEGLTRGHYTLDIQAPGYGRVQETLDVVQPESQHDVMLQSAAQLIVTVSNTQRLPLPGIYVTIVQPGNTDNALAALTDEYGLAHWTDLEPGTYEIRINSGQGDAAQGSSSPNTTVTLTPGTTGRMTLTAEAPTP